jgi:hypothetical protein
MAKKLKKDAPLNRKQKKFVKKAIESDNITKSALAAGYQDPAYGSYLMKQPKIMSALQKALDDAGITDSMIADKLREQLEAWYVKKDGGEKYPDFHARDKAIDKSIKIKGGYAPEKHEIKQEKLVLIVTPETVKGLKDSRVLDKQNEKFIEAQVIEEEKCQ